MDSLDHLRKMINFNKQSGKTTIEDKPICDIYKVIQILDKYKYNEDIRKIYKASLDYERDKNSFSIIFIIYNYKRFKNFESLIGSEYIQDMIKELSECNTLKSFVERIKNRKNYRQELHGDTAIFKTPFL